MSWTMVTVWQFVTRALLLALYTYCIARLAWTVGARRGYEAGRVEEREMWVDGVEEEREMGEGVMVLKPAGITQLDRVVLYDESDGTVLYDWTREDAGQTP